MSNLESHQGAVQTPARLPVMGIAHPLQPLLAKDMRQVAAGVTVASLRPQVPGSLRCYLNGVPLYPITPRQWQRHGRLLGAGREDEAMRYLARAMRRELNWQRTITKPCDIITWYEVLKDKDTLRFVLQIAIVAASIWIGNVYGAGWGAAFSIGANLAVGALLPPSALQDAQSQGGTVYSTSLTGNQARLDQPIWRNCGLTKITPAYAAQPYYEYVDSDGDGLDTDQYLHVVFAIGIGKHDVLRAFIGKTPLDHYQDILVANYLPPGTQPTQVLCNVVTSSEVSGIELTSGRYAGGYVTCQPDRTCISLGLDIAATQGLGTSTGNPVTVSWRVEVREIDRFGRPAGVWRVIANETRSAATNTAQRWSYKYTLTTAARVEVRVARTDVTNTDPGTRSALQWIGLRGYLEQSAPLNAHTAHYELVIRASEQLGAQSQRDISMIVQAYARTWNPVTGWSATLGDYGNYTATRNAAWFDADLLADPVWGLGLTDERIDLQGFYEWAQTCDTRQDRFDYTFDAASNAWDTAQLIARAGRARIFRRFGVVTLARDELVTLPVTAFSPRNTVPGSMTMTEVLPTLEVADGVIIEYTSNITWDIATIECPAPGYSVSDETDPRYNPALPKMTRPVYQRLEGIKGAKHAEREGLYEAAKMLLRTRTAQCTTEMEGVAVCFADPIRWQPEVGGYGQSGDVAFWNAATLTMGLTEPVDWAGSGTTYLTLMRDDGSLTGAVAVTPGPTAYDVVLPAVPDFELVLDDGTRERPKFFLGHLDQLVRVTAITDGGKGEAEEGQEGAQLYDIAGFVDDERVHQADVHLLPGPGEIQDPVDTSGGSDEDDHLFIVNWVDKDISSMNTGAFDCLAQIYLGNDGHAHQDGLSLGVPPDFPHQWMLFGTVDTARAALYEVRATLVSRDSIGTPDRDASGLPVMAVSSDPLDVWLNLGMTRHWDVALDAAAGTLVGVYGTTTRVRIEIRDIATGIVQGSALVTFTCQFLNTG